MAAVLRHELINCLTGCKVGSIGGKEDPAVATPVRANKVGTKLGGVNNRAAASVHQSAGDRRELARTKAGLSPTQRLWVSSR